MEKLIKKIIIKTRLEVLTGLHVGGSSDNVQIGGIDNPVIKIATKKNQPYIPGSSLKGKMRCLLEQVAGATKVGNDENVNNLFGFSNANKISKLIVRDAHLSEESVKLLESCDSLDMPYTESKSENVIDRVKGTAEHPRQIERVPAGVSFEVEFVINVWNTDTESDFKAMLEKGIRLIENDYIGGSGSRGYGQVKFGTLNYTELSEDNNWGK